MQEVEHQQQALWAMHGAMAEKASKRGFNQVIIQFIPSLQPSPGGRGSQRDSGDNKP